MILCVQELCRKVESFQNLKYFKIIQEGQHLLAITYITLKSINIIKFILVYIIMLTKFKIFIVNIQGGPPSPLYVLVIPGMINIIRKRLK